MKKQIIVGFTGKKGSGKSEACKYISSVVKVERINFKDALIAELKTCFPDLLQKMSEIYSMSIDTLFETKPPLVRALMQNFGTEVRRAGYENYWIDEWLESISKSKAYVILVDDVRFLNEAKVVKDAGGIVVRIARPTNKPKDGHTSETEMEYINPDYSISADDIPTLQKKLGVVLERIS